MSVVVVIGLDRATDDGRGHVQIAVEHRHPSCPPRRDPAELALEPDGPGGNEGCHAQRVAQLDVDNVTALPEPGVALGGAVALATLLRLRRARRRAV